MSHITVRARCEIQPEALEPFKALIHQLSALVRAHDHGTLRYDWYFSEDERVCVLIEAYESSEATLAHLGVVAPHLGATLAYAPVAWAKATLSFGLQLTRQEQVVGAEIADEDSVTRVSFTPGRAMLLELAPGVRFLPVSAGPAKPYALLALDLRFYPGYSSVDYQGLTYPALPGGVALGPTLGLGVALDAGERATGFVEVPWTLVLWPSPTLSGAATLTILPDEPVGVGQYLCFKAGVGFRF